MKRLLRVSFDILITSIVPILSWLLLGTILDNKLINIFALTYPMQCIMGILLGIFGTGANICIYKDKNKNAADNGIFYGTLLGFIIFGCFLINIDKYISFMNMDITTYRIFGIYSIIQIYLQTILQLILNKLYYIEENKKSNKLSILFNFINFIVLLGFAYFTKNQIISTSITLIVLLIIDIILLKKNIEKIDFKLNFFNSFKYNSTSICISFMFFLVYLFGFSNSFEYGANYMIAITIATLVTDTQWDITCSIKTVAQVDLAKKKFDYKEHLKNAINLTILLILSVIIMSVIAFVIYKPQIDIVCIFIGLHILDFIISPFINIKVCVLQLEDSALKMTTNILIAYIIRTIVAFLPTPYCTILGQMCSSAYEFVCTKINYKKYQKKLKI